MVLLPRDLRIASSNLHSHVSLVFYLINLSRQSKCLFLIYSRIMKGVPDI